MLRDRAYLTILGALPKGALSRAVGELTRSSAPPAVHHAAIRAFSKAFGLVLEEAEKPVEAYPTFGAFFTRRLKPGLRPIEPGDDVVVSPVDGAISQCGIAHAGRLVQAKGIDYGVGELLADPAEGRRFEGGAFATIYLSPKDYHRIHAPTGGKILGYRYVPGKLWPVNRPSVRNVAGLFAVNERLVTLMDGPLGRVAVVMVGATNVGRIRISYDDVVTNAGLPASHLNYREPITVGKGDELGMFEMGSTVILLFEPGRVNLDPALAPETVLRMGRSIGKAARA